MRKITVIALFLLAMPLTLVDTTKGQKKGSASTTQAVEAQMRGYLEALRKGDVAGIERFLAEDYTFTNSNGEVSTKAQRIANLKGTPPPPSIDFTELVVRVYGDTAVVTGHVTSAAGPDAQALNLRSIWVWAKQGGAWRMVATQITNIAQPQ